MDKRIFKKRIFSPRFRKDVIGKKVIWHPLELDPEIVHYDSVIGQVEGVSKDLETIYLSFETKEGAYNTRIKHDCMSINNALERNLMEFREDEMFFGLVKEED